MRNALSCRLEKLRKSFEDEDLLDERMDMSQPRPLWVIKIGSQLLMDEGPLFVRSLVRDIAELKLKFQINTLIVSSGAIASARMRIKKHWQTLPEKQAL